MDVSEHLNALLVGRYEVEREIGAGGMATVYLARDLRHVRKVALKVLRPELAAVLGPERFLSEIKVTANLQHPHLLPLFDSGEAEGLLFYVMPYVEGETLRDRLERERQLPVDEAVRIGAAVASALDYAHRHNVIHRDLKPENILLHEGQPLVTDFGIALAVSVAGGARVTQTGLSLGTPQYMSPEQATGDRQIDVRSDIYSLGAVVYEMLTGDPPHTASTVQAVIAKVLTDRPHGVRAQRLSVPEHVEAAVLHALEKLPADRFVTAGEFGEALTGARPVSRAGAAVPGDVTVGAAERQASTGRRVPLSAVAGWATAAVALGVIVVGAVLWPRPAPQPLLRLSAVQPSGEALGTIFPNDPDVTISADDRRIVYAGGSGQTRLYVRSLDQLEATPLPGLDQPRSPFLSPDGNWVGYFDAAFNIEKVAVTGGPALTVVTSAGAPRGASWGPDDAIIFATTGSATGLLRVRAAGGTPEVLTTPDLAKGEVDHILPDILPGGRAVLFTVLTAGPIENAQIAVLDLASRQQKVLVAGGSNPRYVGSGHVVYAVGGTLRAVPFDAERLEVRGDPVPVVEGVVTKPGGAATFAVSRGGLLAYLAGDSLSAARRLVWVDRQGREEAIAAPPRAYAYPRLSPDGGRAAVDTRDQDQDVWIWDFSRRTLTRLTFDPALDMYPVWTPDGRRMVFTSQREAAGNALYAQPADGTGAVERLMARSQTEAGLLLLSYALTSDGSHVVVRQDNTGTGADLHMLSLTGERRAEPLIQTPFNEVKR